LHDAIRSELICLVDPPTAFSSPRGAPARGPLRRASRTRGGPPAGKARSAQARRAHQSGQHNTRRGRDPGGNCEAENARGARGGERVRRGTPSARSRAGRAPTWAHAIYDLHAPSRGRAKPGSSGLPARKAEVPDQRSEGSAEYDERRRPYEGRSPRPDRSEVAEAAVQEVWAAACARFGELAMFAGGKSFGGRMTSRAHAARRLAGLRGIIFLGFPLHPPDKPGIERAGHLASAAGPLLFVQGDRDELAGLRRLRPVVAGLGRRATLHVI